MKSNVAPLVDLEQPEYRPTIPELLSAAAASWPDHPAVRAGDQQLSYLELEEAVGRVAAGIRALGLAAGDRVAVLLPKRLETAIMILAVLRAGCVLVPINPALKKDQIDHILSDSEPSMLVTQTDRLGELQDRLPHGGLITVFIDQPPPVPPGGSIGFSRLLETRGRAIHAPDHLQLAALLYTSGSTGKPKGVMVSHRNLAYGIASVAAYLELDQHDRILCSLPFSFDYGLNQLLSAVSVGACAVLIDYFHPQQVLQILERERITGLAGVPTMWVQLANQPWPEGAPGSLRYITNSGDRMPMKVLRALREHLPDTAIYLMYGFTEAFRGTFLEPSFIDERPESIGKPVPDAVIDVVDEQGGAVANGTVGELVQRGPLVTCGYWRDEQRTAEKFASSRADGVHPDWVRSGDLVRRDEEDFLHYIGRRDHLIKTAGYRVSRTEIEDVIASFEGVAEAAVIAVPHEIWGQQIVAFVSSGENRGVDADSLLRHCRRQMPRYMVPAVIECREALPQNSNGKTDYQKLRAIYQSESNQAGLAAAGE